MMQLSRGLLNTTADATALLLKLERPADRVLSEYLRVHRMLGREERAFIAETTFSILRRLRSLEFIAGGRDPRRLVLLALARIQGLSLRELAPWVAREEREWLEAIKQKAGGLTMPRAIELDIPDWLLPRLEAAYSTDEVVSLGRALLDPALLDLRVNVFRTDRNKVLAQLRAEGHDAVATPFSPDGIRLADKPALNRHPLFLDGSIEVQDEGSQLLGRLVAPRRGEMVADFCAGAGGKTLALAAMMRSSGRVYAFDVSVKRLDRLKPRLARSGLSNIYPQWLDSERDPRVGRLAGKLDRVLVDAPCSGFGTLRRNPDLKWRQTEQDVVEMAVKQASILAAAARLVKAQGRLVYGTCSFLAEENENVVREFLANHADFELLPASVILAEQGIEITQREEAFFRIAPHSHQTDGFFAAVLRRVR